MRETRLEHDVVWMPWNNKFRFGTTLEDKIQWGSRLNQGQNVCNATLSVAWECGTLLKITQFWNNGIRDEWNCQLYWPKALYQKKSSSVAGSITLIVIGSLILRYQPQGEGTRFMMFSLLSLWWLLIREQEDRRRNRQRHLVGIWPFQHFTFWVADHSICSLHTAGKIRIVTHGCN